tara:strand:+ start:539 stop:679 length:141 start_codon:yes stop_codon:yes gene_type:complete
VLKNYFSFILINPIKATIEMSIRGINIEAISGICPFVPNELKIKFI